MMLTIRQMAIKKYVQQKHLKNENVTVGELAKAFNITSNEVRTELVALREERKTQREAMKGFEDLFGDFFGGGII